MKSMKATIKSVNNNQKLAVVEIEGYGKYHMWFKGYRGKLAAGEVVTVSNFKQDEIEEEYVEFISK
jgi:late competence protein required for DNA uptake (superfamily II DNA/RNA helicase)